MDLFLVFFVEYFFESNFDFPFADLEEVVFELFFVLIISKLFLGLLYLNFLGFLSDLLVFTGLLFTFKFESSLAVLLSNMLLVSLLHYLLGWAPWPARIAAAVGAWSLGYWFNKKIVFK